MGSLFDYLPVHGNAPSFTNASAPCDTALSDFIDRRLFQAHVLVLAHAMALMQWDWLLALLLLGHVPYAFVRVMPSLLLCWQTVLWIGISMTIMKHGGNASCLWLALLQLTLTQGVMVYKRIWYGMDVHQC